MTKDEAIEYLKGLMIKCYEEQEEIVKSCKNDKDFVTIGMNKIVACVRKYNREWNKQAESNPIMIKDEFSKYMKNEMMKSDFFGEFTQLKKALEYL